MSRLLPALLTASLLVGTTVRADPPSKNVANDQPAAAELSKVAQEQEADEAWEIVIVPNVVPDPPYRLPGQTTVADEQDNEVQIQPCGPTRFTSYEEAYDSIPFSRAEWLANPSYRHDSAMALLTGQPINGRTLPNRNLEEYQDPRSYRRTFFPRLSPADLHYKYTYGWLWYRPYGNWFTPWR